MHVRPRRAAAAVMAVVLGIVGTVTSVATPAGATTFDDVPTDHPFAAPGA